MKNTPPKITLDSFHNYIGIDYEKYDCYEIIQKFYQEVLGKNLDNLYSSRPDKEKTSDFISNEKERFIEVEKPEFGDIIVFNVFGIPCHVGMYVNKDVFFHSRKTTNSCLEKLSIWKKRVVGYYRWP